MRVSTSRDEPAGKPQIILIDRVGNVPCPNATIGTMQSNQIARAIKRFILPSSAAPRLAGAMVHTGRVYSPLSSRTDFPVPCAGHDECVDHAARGRDLGDTLYQA